MTGNMPKMDEMKKDEQSNQKITLSFLLNLFDGVLETPGRITFMTTNFIDKLDKAFTRPGRIDVISKFGFADHSQLIAIIEHRYDKKLTEDQLTIINNLHPCLTPAEISRILFENFSDLDGALQGLIDYVDEYNLKDQRQKEKDIVLKMKVKELEEKSETTPIIESKSDNPETTLTVDSLIGPNKVQKTTDQKQKDNNYYNYNYTDISKLTEESESIRNKDIEKVRLFDQWSPNMNTLQVVDAYNNTNNYTEISDLDTATLEISTQEWCKQPEKIIAR